MGRYHGQPVQLCGFGFPGFIRPSVSGRPSIPPERLFRALLLQAFYSIRSGRQLMERLDVDLLFRWLVGLGIDDPVRDASSHAKNRDRFLDIDGAGAFLAGVVNHPDIHRQMSRDHRSDERRHQTPNTNRY